MEDGTGFKYLGVYTFHKQARHQAGLELVFGMPGITANRLNSAFYLKELLLTFQGLVQ
ncbi:hypothetical protein DYBT9275_05879 [Dyadobacter sp. CECT 9275]|uniref:Uncharacterized protein n=1 Tax=Dyadobacter helix TaxID=2822344 RepID=A0A916JIL5_9BACT|nr:hypothetical protein DYBT9275_05879 [Dyadobacter sp. CECT 9275]